ncbi:GGDEF domain-containing protein [Patescibacteria group bacterium]|nr:GGDEF domain-containing protein [Patescibacteria group bacterium]MBU2632913.1 GGDEF domain-containing protein [Patescibacteria group bacterium]
MAKKQDIKKLEKEIERLQHLAYYDELTDVYNRRGFLNVTNRAFESISLRRTEIERRIGFQIPFSVIFFDIDDFKKINDLYGHDVGDKVLKNVGKILRLKLRPSDFYGRWGGEEFVLALIGANMETGRIVAEKIRGEIEQTKIVAKGKKIGVTASFGVVVYRKEKKLSEIIKEADQAMYEAKKQGKNRVVLQK